MPRNLALWDRALRWTLGTLGLAWAIAGGPPWAYASIYLIITSTFGICPIYLIVGFK